MIVVKCFTIAEARAFGLTTATELALRAEWAIERARDFTPNLFKDKAIAGESDVKLTMDAVSWMRYNPDFVVRVFVWLCEAVMSGEAVPEVCFYYDGDARRSSFLASNLQNLRRRGQSRRFPRRA